MLTFCEFLAESLDPMALQKVISELETILIQYNYEFGADTQSRLKKVIYELRRLAKASLSETM
jgi:hypothetical protein